MMAADSACAAIAIFQKHWPTIRPETLTATIYYFY